MMIVPRRQDAYHKMQLLRLLMAIIDQEKISTQICFKGGSCAALLGFLDRFSIDLDFDLLKGVNREAIRSRLHQVFVNLGLEIKDESQTTLQFFLRYSAKPGQRNTLKLEILDEIFDSDVYRPQYLTEIDRYGLCQTIETMFAHKLVALIDRYEKNKSIAARDLYDIHHFFSQGYSYEQAIIRERRGVTVNTYLKELIDFVQGKITQTIIDQDLNTILPRDKFVKIRQQLKAESLMFLQDELKRLGSDQS